MKLCSFRLALGGKVGTKLPESSRLEFSREISVNSIFIRFIRQHFRVNIEEIKQLYLT